MISRKRNLPLWERMLRAVLGLAAFVAAALLLRGCPMCWLAGLWQAMRRGQAGD